MVEAEEEVVPIEPVPEGEEERLLEPDDPLSCGSGCGCVEKISDAPALDAAIVSLKRDAES